MEREGDTEWLTLRYEQSSAGRYHAEFASFPKTVTLTLPGTERVEILSELSRAQDTSQYIKSVYTAEGWVDSAAVVQLELESDADVQLREYQEPGSIVIRLTPAENRLDTIYSLRTLSADSPEALRAMAAPEEGARLLRDDAGRLFVELGQYDTREKAERAAGDRGAAGLIPWSGAPATTCRSAMRRRRLTRVRFCWTGTMSFFKLLWRWSLSLLSWRNTWPARPPRYRTPCSGA